MQLAKFVSKMSLKMKRKLISVLTLFLLGLYVHAQGLPPATQQLLERSRRLLEEFDQDLPLDSAQKRLCHESFLSYCPQTYSYHRIV